MAVRILHNQSNTSYHADLALGSTYIKDWHLRSPRHAEHGVKTINRYTADEGTAAHFEFSNDGDLVIMAGETRRAFAGKRRKHRPKQSVALRYPSRRTKPLLQQVAVRERILLCSSCYQLILATFGLKPQSLPITRLACRSKHGLTCTCPSLGCCLI